MLRCLVCLISISKYRIMALQQNKLFPAFESIAIGPKKHRKYLLASIFALPNIGHKCLVTIAQNHRKSKITAN